MALLRRNTPISVSRWICRTAPGPRLSTTVRLLSKSGAKPDHAVPKRWSIPPGPHSFGALTDLVGGEKRARLLRLAARPRRPRWRDASNRCAPSISSARRNAAVRRATHIRGRQLGCGHLARFEIVSGNDEVGGGHDLDPGSCPRHISIVHARAVCNGNIVLNAVWRSPRPRAVPVNKRVRDERDSPLGQ